MSKGKNVTEEVRALVAQLVEQDPKITGGELQAIVEKDLEQIFAQTVEWGVDEKTRCFPSGEKWGFSLVPKLVRTR